MAKFKVGDRVRVSYGHGWDGHGTIESIDKGWDCIVVEMDDGRTGGFSGRHIHSFEPVAVAPATATEPTPIGIDLTSPPPPQVGDDVLIFGTIAAINQSPRGTNYNIVFETQNRRMSLHFLEEDFILDEDGGDEGDCPCANNDNGPVPTSDRAKAFDAIGDWLRAVAVRRAA